MIIQLTVGLPLQVCPNLSIVPRNHREDPHELRPVRRALCKWFQVRRPRISGPIAHDYCGDALFVDEALDFSLEVGAEQLDLDVVERLDLLTKFNDLFEFVLLDEMNKFEIF